MTSGPDPHGDFSFEEVGGPAVAAPTATAKSPVSDDDEVTEHELSVTGPDTGQSAEPTEIEGMTPLGASVNREGTVR